MQYLIPIGRFANCCRDELLRREAEWLNSNAATKVSDLWLRAVSTASVQAPGVLDHLQGLGHLTIAEARNFVDAVRIAVQCSHCHRVTALHVISARLMAYGLRMALALCGATVCSTARGCNIDVTLPSLHRRIALASQEAFLDPDSPDLSSILAEVEEAMTIEYNAGIMRGVALAELWILAHEMMHAYHDAPTDGSFLQPQVSELVKGYAITETRARYWARELEADCKGMNILAARLHGFGIAVHLSHGGSPMDAMKEAYEQALLAGIFGLLLLEVLEENEGAGGEPMHPLYFDHPPSHVRRRWLYRQANAYASMVRGSVDAPASTFEAIWLAALRNTSRSGWLDDLRRR